GARILTTPDGQQLVDLSFELRRRRYGASHGVGLLHRLPGLEGTYAALSTAPALLTAALRRHPRRVPWCRWQAKGAARPGDAGHVISVREMHGERHFAL